MVRYTLRSGTGDEGIISPVRISRNRERWKSPNFGWTGSVGFMTAWHNAGPLNDMVSRAVSIKECELVTGIWNA